MDLKYSIEDMKQIYEIFSVQTKKYLMLIEKLDFVITQLENYWSSDDNSLYIEFKNKYLEKKHFLIEAHENMIIFCNKLGEKIVEFEEANIKITNSFN